VEFAPEFEFENVVYKFIVLESWALFCGPSYIVPEYYASSGWKELWERSWELRLMRM
jgi:hypothetical protein